jgi:hypothetical protein
VYWVSNEVCEHCTWKKKEDEDRKKEKLLQRARECRRQRMSEPGAKDARNDHDRKVYDPEQQSTRRRKNYAAKKRSKEDCEKDFHAQRQRALEKQFGKVAVTAKAKSSVPENATSTAAKKPLSSSSKQTTPAKTQVEVKPAIKKPLPSSSKQTTPAKTQAEVKHANKKPVPSSSKQTAPAKTQVEVKPAKNAFGGIIQKKKKKK